MKTRMMLYLVIFLVGCGGTCDRSTYKVQAWPGGIVRYQLNVSTKIEKLVLEVFEEIESKTNIKFLESLEDVYVDIYEWQKDYSEATLGYTQYPYINFESDVPKWVIYHEILHVLGLTHEHQRMDRDNHININYNNIPKIIHYDFILSNNFLYDVTQYPYDKLSIMHYSSYTYAKKGYSITTTKGKVIKQVYKPSQLDWIKLNDIYQ